MNKKNNKENMPAKNDENPLNINIEGGPLKSVYFHFRFKFLALTTIFFLLYLILSGASSWEEFTSSPEFSLLGPFLIITMISFFIFRSFPVKCPECRKSLSTKKDWLCTDCGQLQGRSRYLMDKCLHCKNIQAIATCDHCGAKFRL